MMTSQPKEEKLLGFSWNVPNILTITRMVLVPVFLVVFLLHPNDQTWRLWSLHWQASGPGDHTITVRATDNTGAVQTSDQAPTVPDGATGWHTVYFTVT